MKQKIAWPLHAECILLYQILAEKTPCCIHHWFFWPFVFTLSNKIHRIKKWGHHLLSRYPADFLPSRLWWTFHTCCFVLSVLSQSKVSYLTMMDICRARTRTITSRLLWSLLQVQWRITYFHFKKRERFVHLSSDKCVLVHHVKIKSEERER